MNSRTTKSTANFTSNIFSAITVEHLAEPYIFKHLKTFGSAECSTDITEVGIIKNPKSIYHFPTISHQNPFFLSILPSADNLFCLLMMCWRCQPNIKVWGSNKISKNWKIYSDTNWYNFWTKLQTACVWMKSAYAIDIIGHCTKCVATTYIVKGGRHRCQPDRRSMLCGRDVELAMWCELHIK